MPAKSSQLPDGHVVQFRICFQGVNASSASDWQETGGRGLSFERQEFTRPVLSLPEGRGPAMNNKMFDMVFNLKFQAKQLNRQATKCEKNEKQEKVHKNNLPLHLAAVQTC